MASDANASGGSYVKFGSSSGGGTKCGLANIAFCDTFDASQPAGERSGDLASVLGVSRTKGGGFNSGQGANCVPNYSANNTVPVVSVDSTVTIKNYVENDPENEINTGNVVTTRDNCIKEPTQAGQLNHFEIDVSQSQIDVYGTDAGTTTTLKHLVTIPNVNLGFTRGLIWLEDVHYNGSKDLSYLINGQHVFQGEHTFT